MEIGIRNCAFKFRCHQQWTELERTDNPKIRFCNECEEDVHYVHTNKELKAAIAKNFCVALVVKEQEYDSGFLLGKIINTHDQNSE